MKRQIIKILSILFLIGCNNIEYKPKYKDFENDWERENLIGKVKKLEQYKANVTDFETGKTECPIIEFKMAFTEYGKISCQENFDDFGNLEQYIKNTYDKNGLRIKSVSENLTIPTKSIEKIVFDTITKQPISAHSIIDDTLKIDAYFKYDENGNLVESISIENSDTTINNLEYKYDGNNNIILKKQIQKVESDVYEYFTEYEYNQDGNIIELSYRSDFSGEMKERYEYDKNNRLRKKVEYQSGKMQKETSFDKFYNKTSVKFYLDNTLNKEIKYEYKYDRKGNWIQRDAFMNEYLGDKKTNMIFTETREIEYYDE